MAKNGPLTKRLRTSKEEEDDDNIDSDLLLLPIEILEGILLDATNKKVKNMLPLRLVCKTLQNVVDVNLLSFAKPHKVQFVDSTKASSCEFTFDTQNFMDRFPQISYSGYSDYHFSPFFNVHCLQHVEIHESTITDLTGFSHLKSVKLVECLKLESLHHLEGVSTVHVQDCPRIKDLTPLSQASFVYLQSLPKVKDVSPLSLVQRVGLTCMGSVKDVSSLSQVDSLRISKLSALSSVTCLTGVRKLQLLHLGIEDVSTLGKVEELEFHFCFNLRSLRGLENAKRLWVLGCPIIDMGMVHYVPNLLVHFYGNNLPDLLEHGVKDLTVSVYTKEYFTNKVLQSVDSLHITYYYYEEEDLGVEPFHPRYVQKKDRYYYWPQNARELIETRSEKGKNLASCFIVGCHTLYYYDRGAAVIVEDLNKYIWANHHRYFDIENFFAAIERRNSRPGKEYHSLKREKYTRTIVYQEDGIHEVEVQAKMRTKYTKEYGKKRKSTQAYINIHFGRIKEWKPSLFFKKKPEQQQQHPLGDFSSITELSQKRKKKTDADPCFIMLKQHTGYYHYMAIYS